MSMVTMKKMLVDARRERYALGGFEFWSSDSAKAVVDAGNELKLPVILQSAPVILEFMGYKNVEALAIALAKYSDVPVTLHLDHANTLEQIKMALDNGFTSVMMDASSKSFNENVELTAKTVEMARKYGATIEAELGHVGGLEFNVDSIAEEEALQTDPQEAKKYVELTGIDFLAVAVGTVHGIYRFEPKLNIDRLKKIEEIIDIPLVLHGGSGTPVEASQEAIRHGIAKINICTDVLVAMGESYINTQKSPDFKMGVMDLIIPPFNAMKSVIKMKMEQFDIR